MLIYRAYPVSKNHQIAAAPSVAINCENDQDGIYKKRNSRSTAMMLSFEMGLASSLDLKQRRSQPARTAQKRGEPNVSGPRRDTEPRFRSNGS
jgi:hypothetical protein